MAKAQKPRPLMKLDPLELEWDKALKVRKRYTVQAREAVAGDVMPNGEIPKLAGETDRDGNVLTKSYQVILDKNGEPDYCLSPDDFIAHWVPIGRKGFYKSKGELRRLILLKGKFNLMAPKEWGDHKGWDVIEPVAVTDEDGFVHFGYPVIERVRGKEYMLDRHIYDGAYTAVK